MTLRLNGICVSFIALAAVILISALPLAAQQCTFSITPTSRTFPATGGDGQISMTASGGSCPRTVTSNAAWITITFGQSGTGDGSAGYNVQSNPTAVQRTGTINAAGQTFTVTQAATCSYVLTPSQIVMPVNGGTGTFSITTASSCTWTVASTVDWVLVTAGGSGTGSGTVTFAVAANSRQEPRTAAITLGNTSFLVSQPAAGCTVSIDPESATVPSDGGQGAIQVNAPSSCPWAATKNADWVTLIAPVSGTGEGVVRYTASANTSIQTRRTGIIIADKTFQLVQTPANCNVGVSMTSMSIAATGGTGNVQITANCPWQASANVPWIQFTSSAAGASNALLNFSAQANTGGSSRTGNIAVNGHTIVVTQPSQACTLSVTPLTFMMLPHGGAAIANVTGSPSCDWMASSAEGWIEATWTRANGSGRVTANVKPNASGAERTGTIVVSGSAITVRQLAITLNSNSIVNAATFLPGAVAPGEVITVFGSRFGPPALVQFSADNPFPRTLGDTRVLFDGVSAPMIYTTEGQASAIVPYAVAGKSVSQVQVEYLGALSNSVPFPVAAASPGIFTLAASGTGPGAILNQDFSLNTAQTPAARGSVIQIFATGEGQTNPAGSDGKLAVEPLPAPLQPVIVTIGGRPATVAYAGAAPGLVAGVIQVNAFVPEDVTPGPAVPIMIRIGEFASRDGVTLSVR
jgi:uncharacterized protein (TIGR03437 family)